MKLEGTLTHDVPDSLFAFTNKTSFLLNMRTSMIVFGPPFLYSHSILTLTLKLYNGMVFLVSIKSIYTQYDV